MPPPAEAPPIGLVLEKLRDYMHGFYPERANSSPLPLEFWQLEDDDLFLEVLGYLPLFMGDLWQTHRAQLPEAFRLAYPIFWIEDDYQVNGWTALGNAGDDLLPSAISAYRRIGMETEARALEAAYQAYGEDPEDEDAHEAAYKSVMNPFADDEMKYGTLLSFFRANADLWRYDGA